jgi:hypothetical protein
VRITLLAFTLFACAVHVQASVPPNSFHVVNISDQVVEIWINGDSFEILPDSGMMVPCIEHEVHAVQTATEWLEVTCGTTVEMGR